MEFNIELKGFKEAIQSLNPENVLKAARKTIQRAAGAGKTIISSQIREKFNIKKADLDRKITVGLSNIAKAEATLSVIGEPISLTHFGPTQISGGVQTFVSKDKGIAQKKIRSSKFKGVSVRIIKKKTTKLRSAFIARGKGGTPMVFRRVGKKRLPIRALKVISYTSILKKKENIDAVIKRIDEQLVKEWERNIKEFTKPTASFPDLLAR